MTRLSEEEVQSLAPVLAAIGARAKRLLTLEELLSGWREFVGQVQAGYMLTGYDYANDLSTRDLLEELLVAAREPLRTKLADEIIAPVDAQFRSATRVLTTPLRLGSPEQPHWWWFRAPNDLTGELAADLLADT